MLACSGPQNVQSNRYDRLYDFEAKELHPEFLIHHVSQDSSDVHFSLRASEYLFTRSGTDQPYKSEIKIEYKIVYMQDMILTTIDSGLVILDAERIQGQNENIVGKFKIASLDNRHGTCEVTVTDGNRKISQPVRIEINRRDGYALQNILIRNSSGRPFFNMRLSLGDSYEIYCPLLTGELQIIEHDPAVDLPPPPFSDSKPVFPELLEETRNSIELDKNGLSPIELYPGIFSVGDQNELLLTFSVSDEFFPEIKTFEAMSNSLRYITSRAEYDGIIKSKNPQKKLEQFWSDCAGSEDRAKELIRIYYKRVEEANRYFSSGIPGWKSDRGLIHIIFGNPQTVEHDRGSEIWFYGEPNNAASLRFTFDIATNKTLNNYYIMRRDRLYKAQWERAVTSWRNGKIYED